MNRIALTLAALLMALPFSLHAAPVVSACEERRLTTEASAALAAKDLAAAVDTYGRALQLDFQDDWARYHRANLEAQLGRNDKALSDYLIVARTSPDILFTSYNLARLYALRGSLDTALTLLEQALAKGYLNAARVRTEPDLASLRRDPRFERLLARYSGRSPLPSPELAYESGKLQQREAMVTRNAPFSLLRMATRDLSGRVRQKAFATFSMQRTPAALEELTLGLCDADRQVARTAAIGLSGIGSEALPAVRPLLDAQHAFGAAFAAQVVGDLHDQGSVLALRSLLRSVDTDVRLAAVTALGELDAVEALADLEKTETEWPDEAGRLQVHAVVRHLRSLKTGDAPSTNSEAASPLPADTDARSPAAADAAPPIVIEEE